MKLLGTKKLETERLVLRRLKKADAEEAFNSWCNNDDVPRFLPWERHRNVDETKALYEMWEKEYADMDTFRWIVELKSSHELIGTIDVVDKESIKFDVAEVGYCYGKRFWGHGYGTEALKRVIKYLFEECEAEVVCAKHYSNNPASGKIMQKSGMHLDGILRNRVVDKDGKRNNICCYSIIREEYQKNK